MAYYIDLKTITDIRGNLTVVENNSSSIPFTIKRLYYIYNVDNLERGGHRHKETIQWAICITGSCRLNINDGETQKSYVLDNPKKCLILEPKDWHTMDNFSKDAVLMVVASDHYNADDYIYEPYGV